MGPSAGRLIRITNVLGAFALTYDGATPRRREIVYPTDQRTRYVYQPSGADSRLRRILHLDPRNQALSRFAYQYAADGTLTQWTRAA